MRSLPAWLGAGSALFLSLPAGAQFPPTQPKVLLHIGSTTAKNACAPANLTSCGDVDVEGLSRADGSAPYFVYLIVARGTTSCSIAGVQCAIDYSWSYNHGPGAKSDGQGIDIHSWTLCATLEFKNTVWPDPGGGNLITWDATSNCQTRDLAIAGYFYVTAYAPDDLRITKRPVDDYVAVADCSGNVIPLGYRAAGGVGFSPTGNSGHGCNPCWQDCFIVDPVVAPPSGSIGFHVVSQEQQDPCSGVNLTNCTQAVVQGDLSGPAGTYHYVYIFADRGEGAPVNGLSCGVSYDFGTSENMSDGAGVDILDWTLCADAESRSTAPAWPEPGSGITLSWNPSGECPTLEPRIGGYFYVAAYSPSSLILVGDPRKGRAELHRDLFTTPVLPEQLAQAAFSDGASDGGCNPCLIPCEDGVPVVSRTWSAIKTLVR
jgi:hypothetical protein